MTDLEKMRQRKREEEALMRKYPELFDKDGEQSGTDDDNDEDDNDNDDDAIKNIFAPYTSSVNKKEQPDPRLGDLDRDISTLRTQIRKNKDPQHGDVLRTELARRNAELKKIKDDRKHAAKQKEKDTPPPRHAAPLRKIITVSSQARGVIEYNTRKYTEILEKIAKAMRKDNLNPIFLVGNTMDRYTVEEGSTHDTSNNYRVVFPLEDNQRSRAGPNLNSENRVARATRPDFAHMPADVRSDIIKMVANLKTHFPVFHDNDERMD